MMRGMGLMDEAQNLKRDGENRNGSHELSRANAMSRTRADIEEFIHAMTKLGVPPGQHRYKYGSITKIDRYAYCRKSGPLDADHAVSVVRR